MAEMDLHEAIKIIGCIVLTLIIYAVPIVLVVALFLDWNVLVTLPLGFASVAELGLLCGFIYCEVDDNG